MTQRLLLLFLMLIAGTPLWAQGRYVYYSSYQYTGTSGKITVQLPTVQTGWKARMLDLYLSCPSAACTVTYTTGGGLATTTAGTSYRTRSDTPATSKAAFYYNSNATGGTAGPAIPFSTPGAMLDLKDFDLQPGQALTITAASDTQTVTMVARWEEYE